MFNRLLDQLSTVHPLSEALKERLCELLLFKEIPKKSFLLKAGEISNHIYFISRGFVRSFTIKGDKEVTGWFMKENDVIISVASFFKRVPSEEFIQAIEDTIVYYTNFQELQDLYKSFPEFNIHGRLIVTRYYILCEERLFIIRMQSAQERFQILLDKHPEILHRAPLGQIATYLGISLETLSRMRARR